jgi:DNA repair exonuclease SbcCD ATPase subunit
MKKKIKISECFDLFRTYGDLNLKVNTPYGYKHIEACDITAKNSNYVTITTENNKTLICSPKHKIMASNGRFIVANELVIGKSKILTDDGPSILKSFESSKNKKDLYDIQVDDVQQYYSNGILSHNSTIMKLITYLLYSKSIETEKREKYGDSRYVNKYVEDDFCEGEIVIKANEEYFGIKKKTIISKKKDDEIKGASTGVKYYKLNSPDDELLDSNDIDNLTDEDKIQTQKLIDKTIGTYENFKRVVMTTSDTLNDILSDDSSVFIDSLLYDSGLDIFDKKLEIFKDYLKEVFKEKIVCNVEKSTQDIKTLTTEIDQVNNVIKNIEKVEIPAVKESIKKGNDFVESLIKKLHKIDDNVYNFDLNNANGEIKTYDTYIDELEQKKLRLENSISKLSNDFKQVDLDNLQTHKESYKNQIYDLKIEIKNLDSAIDSQKYEKSKINGDIVRLKNQGVEKKDEWVKLKESKNCPTCGQLITSKEHQAHVSEKIERIKNDLLNIKDQINIKIELIPTIDEIIEKHKAKQVEIEEKIAVLSVKSDEVLNEIGVLVNKRNDFEKRKLLVVDLNNIPTQRENYQLKIDNVKKNIEIYEKSLIQINENRETNEYIKRSKTRLSELELQENELNDDVFEQKTIKSQKEQEILRLEELIKKFNIQERKELIMNTYKKCTHRNGIPTQLLVNYAIPKINNELNKTLEDVDFNVWLDTYDDDIKLKLSYNSEANAINAVSGSGKERTFAAICLKFALNQINAKSKPTIFLLDEVSGKLVDDSVTEFVNILHLIKKRVKKILIIEHNIELNPDHLISVTRDEGGNSLITIE